METLLASDVGIDTVVRAVTSHHCGPGLIPGPGVQCRLSWFLILVLTPRVFSLGCLLSLPLLKPTFQISVFQLERVDWKSHLVECPLIYIIVILIIIIIITNIIPFLGKELT